MIDIDKPLMDQLHKLDNDRMIVSTRLDCMVEARTETQHYVNDNYPDEKFRVSALYPTDDVNDYIVSFFNEHSEKGGYAYYRSYYGVTVCEVWPYVEEAQDA